MCIAAIGLSGIASLLSAGVGAVGSIAAATAASNAAEYKKKQAIIMAEDAKKRGAQKEEAQRLKTAALLSRQRAVMAGSNLDLTSGSPLNILADTAMVGELDAGIIRGNAEREAQGHYATADLAGMEAKSAKTAGMFDAFGTVLGGVGTVASKWYSTTSPVAIARDPWKGLRTA